MNHLYRTFLLLLLFAFTSVRYLPGPVNAEDKPLFTFSVLSDIHVAAWDGESHRRFREALADHASLYPDSKLMVLNGDLTNGDEEDYRSLARLLEESPHAPVHATMGNHEYYRMWRTPDGSMDTTRLSGAWSSREAMDLFTKHFGYAKPYHALEVNGFQFLFLSGEGYRDVNPAIGEDANLSKEQLRWLEAKLEAVREQSGASRNFWRKPSAAKPVFVFLHQPLAHTLDGTDRERGVVQDQELRSLLKRHPEVILFSGHTHWDLATTKQFRQLSFLAVGSSSVRQVLNTQNEPDVKPKSQSLIVEVYKNRVVIRGREHSTREWAGPPFYHAY